MVSFLNQKEVAMKKFVFCFLTMPLWAKSNTVQKFSELFKAGRVGVKITSIGGHLDKCVNVKFTNNSNKPLDFEVEPGLFFDSDDNNVQNLITTRTELVKLLPGKQVNVLLNAFCIQAHQLSPRPDASFTYRGFADSSLVRLANFIDAQKISGELTQQAIWVLSDRNPLESISSGPEDLKQKMLNYLIQNHRLKRKGNYEIVYRYLPEVAFSGQVLKVKGKIAYQLEEGSYNSLLIQDEKGKTYTIIMYREFEKAGNYERKFEFRTKDLPKGVFYARLYSNQKIIAEEVIDLS